MDDGLGDVHEQKQGKDMERKGKPIFKEPATTRPIMSRPTFKVDKFSKAHGKKKSSATNCGPPRALWPSGHTIK